MINGSRLARIWLAVAGCLVVLPASAHAQWYFGGYLGASHTQRATVSLREPDLSLDFHDVHFYSLSQAPRRYYGLRLGRMNRARRVGFEIELIHMKAIADTTREYSVTALDGTVLPASGAAPMNTVVQEYQMTHGLNFALVNLVLRQRVAALAAHDVAVMLRAGGGPTFPHGETTVNDAIMHKYQYAGFGAHAAAGLEIDLPFRAQALAEYKLTYAHPTIDTARGTASSRALSHHIAIGVGISLTAR